MWRGSGYAASAYCERLGPGLWAEPLNAVSNAAFLVAAALAFRAWRGTGGRDRPALILILIVGLIGFGSFAFHTAPSPLTLLADVMPIQLFVLGAFGLAMRRHVEAPLLVVGCAVAALALAGLARWGWGMATAALPPVAAPALLAGVGSLGGVLVLSVVFWGVKSREVAFRGNVRSAEAASTTRGLVAVLGAALVAWPFVISLPRAAAGYGAGLAAIIGAAAAMTLRARRAATPAERKHRGEVARHLALAGVVFATSLTLRQLDRPLCAVWPFGTHFLWHVLNAVVLHRLLIALMHIHGSPEAAKPAPR